MNNSDQSAGVLPAEFCGEGINCTGLTKREAFVKAILSNVDLNMLDDQQEIDGTVEMAIRLADKALEELAK